ncbi:MAG: biotin--[acetyl-CoA-carboxylase] ligase [Thermoguttaceae bacterium]
MQDTIDLDRILRTTFVASAEYHPTLTSTNEQAARLAGGNCPPLPLLVVAGQQTAGRGRGTNRWWTGPGSLAFSLLLDPAEPAAPEGPRSTMLALAAGIAVADALTPLLPAETVGIHWPNDVMAGRRKLSGILVEVLPDGRSIVGIGVNTNNTAADAPPEIQALVGTVRDLSGLSHDQTALLWAILGQFEQRLAQVAAEARLLAARADALCSQRGRQLSVQRGNEVITGLCLGLGPDGALLLETPAGRRAVYSGVVLTPPVA